MKTGVFLTVTALAGTAVLVAQMKVEAGPGEGGIAGDCTPPPGIGPDVIIGSLPAFKRWGKVGDITGYSIASTSCNIGDEDLDWDRDTNNHPVIGQHLYRLKDGRFEQIGLSWLKHGFAALTQELCCDCQSPGTSQKLGVGCSDPYDAILNGDQNGHDCGNNNICGGLGPRFEVDATTGFFEYPYGSAGESGPDIYKRLQVHDADLEPDDNPGAIYYGEGHYVTPDDAARANHHNNTAHHQATVAENSPGVYNLSFTGSTVRELPAIYGWQANDPQVGIEVIEDDDDPGDDHDGRFYLGHRVTDNGNGTWHYEYALYNMNSHRSAREFSLPVPGGVTVTSVGFHDVDHHSGDGEGGVNYDGTDWPVATAGGQMTWATETWAENTNANALRWGTLYNFRFDANSPPWDVAATIGLFRPGTPSELSVMIPGPSDMVVCPWDLDGDSTVGIGDLLALFAIWGTPGPEGDFNDDGIVGVGDLLLMFANWGPCP